MHVMVSGGTCPAQNFKFKVVFKFSPYLNLQILFTFKICLRSNLLGPPLPGANRANILCRQQVEMYQNIELHVNMVYKSNHHCSHVRRGDSSLLKAYSAATQQLL